MKLKPRARFAILLLMTLAGTTIDSSHADAQGVLLITDFTEHSPDLGWYVLNDNVMGGASEGDVDREDGVLHFAGRTDTDGGGFSSIRTQPLELDLARYTGIRLRARGDGRRYTWRLATDARYRDRQLGYWAEFDTTGGIWQTIDIPFASFLPRFRGTRLDGPPLDPGAIRVMGLMIYDQQDGLFELELASVHAYLKEAF